MKICLYFEAEKMLQTSGIGRALQHQKRALESVGIEYTLDPEDEYDLLHINTVGINSSNVISSARKRNKKVLYHAHSTEEDFRDSFLLSNQVAPFFKRHIVNLYTQADAIITPTPYAKTLLEAYGLTMPIYAVSNGIDLKHYVKDDQKIKAFRKYFGLSKSQKVVISVGLYLKRKGIQDFMEVAKRFPEVQFIWFGYTPLISIPSSIRQLIEDHPNNVILPGYVKGPIIEGAYACADHFFFPSYEETEGIVVLEALASRCPVLVRDIGVFNPWLTDGLNCHKAQDNDGFSRVLRQSFEGSLVSTTETGYQTAHERTLSHIGQQLKVIYTQLLNEGGSR